MNVCPLVFNCFFFVKGVNLRLYSSLVYGNYVFFENIITINLPAFSLSTTFSAFKLKLILCSGTEKLFISLIDMNPLLHSNLNNSFQVKININLVIRRFDKKNPITFLQSSKTVTAIVEELKTLLAFIYSKSIFCFIVRDNVIISSVFTLPNIYFAYK